MSTHSVGERSTILSRRSLVLSVLIGTNAAMQGCGPVMYTVAVLEATNAVEEARQAGAPTTAPYEFYYAQSHLDHAREEAGEAEYQHAVDAASVAREYGIRARDLARRRARESGR
jgi:hypothetical protein